MVSAYLCALDAGDDPRLEQVLTPAGPCTLEEAFVAVGAAYAARHRISTEAWRAVGTTSSSQPRPSMTNAVPNTPGWHNAACLGRPAEGGRAEAEGRTAALAAYACHGAG